MVVNSELQLEALLTGQFSALDIHEILYQEIIPGGGAQQWSYAGLFVQGNPVAAFTACRLRQHPPDFGRASTYVVAEYNSEVEEESRKIMAVLQYTGLGEVEWKRDPRDGKTALSGSKRPVLGLACVWPVEWLAISRACSTIMHRGMQCLRWCRDMGRDG